jgi:hypothetical protein
VFLGCGSGGGSGQGILWRTATALGRSLESFDGSVELVSLGNKKSNNLSCGHPENRSTVGMSIFSGILSSSYAVLSVITWHPTKI